MSKAFKCDHCGKFFTSSRGSHFFTGEVCDAKRGYVRYRVKGFVFSSKGPLLSDLYESDKELCDGCIRIIICAALKKEKL